MNEKRFTQLLQDLDDSNWQQLLDGQAILIVDDQRLEMGAATDPAVIIKSLHEKDNLTQLKQETIQDAAKFLSNYYFVHPLTEAGFNYQVEQHIEEKGAGSFVATAGQFPSFTLFVDGGEVIAESPDSPRFPYGAFCELENPVADSALEDYVKKWVQQGDAYNRYLSMNVCRYNC